MQENEMDEMGLGLAKQQKIRDCCVHIHTESCLDHNILDEVAALNGRTV